MALMLYTLPAAATGRHGPSKYSISKGGVCPEAQLTQLTHDKRVIASGANKVNLIL